MPSNAPIVQIVQIVQVVYQQFMQVVQRSRREKQKRGVDANRRLFRSGYLTHFLVASPFLDFCCSWVKLLHFIHNIEWEHFK